MPQIPAKAGRGQKVNQGRGSDLIRWQKFQHHCSGESTLWMVYIAWPAYPLISKKVYSARERRVQSH